MATTAKCIIVSGRPGSGKTTLDLLRADVSVVVEAAFQHELWSRVVPEIQRIARPCIVICDLDAETSVRRHLERGLSDPYRELCHGDRRVAIYRETGRVSPGAPYDAPRFDVPTLCVATQDGYSPGLEEIEAFVMSTPS